MGLAVQQTLLRSSMRSLILVLVVSFVQAKKAKGGKGGKPAKEEPSGLCLSEEKMMMLCHAGSALGEKANAGMEVCAANAEEGAKKGKGKGKAKGKGKGKGKGKSPKCPTVAEIMDMAGEEYAGEMCVFTELGWMDNDMNSDEELIQADIDTLPTEIAEALNGDEYDQCVTKAEEKMASMAPECDASYTEEEMARLGELGNAVANTECFKAIFAKSCGSYIKNTMASMFGAMMPAGK